MKKSKVEGLRILAASVFNTIMILQDYYRYATGIIGLQNKRHFPIHAGYLAPVSSASTASPLHEVHAVGMQWTITSHEGGRAFYLRKYSSSCLMSQPRNCYNEQE